MSKFFLCAFVRLQSSADQADGLSVRTSGGIFSVTCPKDCLSWQLDQLRWSVSFHLKWLDIRHPALCEDKMEVYTHPIVVPKVVTFLSQHPLSGTVRLHTLGVEGP